jgi:hypothetical protein
MKVLMKKLMYLILFYLVNLLRDDIDDGKCGGTVKGIIFIRDDIDDGKCGGTVNGIIFIRDDIDDGKCGVCKCSATFSSYYDFSYNDHNHFKLLCSYMLWGVLTNITLFVCFMVYIYKRE